MANKFVNPPGVHTPFTKTYTHAVKAGNTIYVSGQVGCDVDGNVVPGGFQAQAKRAFENLRLVLEECGASMRDIVKVNTYLTDMSNLPQLTALRSRYFSELPPASTLLQVPALALPDLLIEVEAVAVLEL